MKARVLLLFLMSFTISVAIGQNTIDLTFTAVDSSAYVKLDSIKVINRTQGLETVISWPDTTLSLEINPGDLLLCVGYITMATVGISEVIDDISSFTINQNYPNPMKESSEISMYIPYTGKVRLMVSDLYGRVVLRTDRQLDKGHHSFRFHPGGGNLFFLTAHWNGMRESIKMISTGQQFGKSCQLDYLGNQSREPVLKKTLQVSDFIVWQSGILDSPEESTSYTFQFATNIPCLGTPTVEYEGQVYSTIQIFSQCWLKENLNVGVMISGVQNQTNKATIEKYCYNNEPDSCAKYGGLYQWGEMMQYTNQQGAQGICPPGWHAPTDEEWKVLEGAVDSQYGIGDPEWDYNWGYRGYDAGTILKATSGWNRNGNGTDLFGFTSLPGGFLESYGSIGYFKGFGYDSRWWASTEKDSAGAYLRMLYDLSQRSFRLTHYKTFGFSVRCLRDY